MALSSNYHPIHPLVCSHFALSLLLYTDLTIAIGHKKPYLGPESRKEEFIEFAIKL